MSYSGFIMKTIAFLTIVKDYFEVLFNLKGILYIRKIVTYIFLTFTRGQTLQIRSRPNWAASGISSDSRVLYHVGFGTEKDLFLVSAVAVLSDEKPTLI